MESARGSAAQTASLTEDTGSSTAAAPSRRTQGLLVGLLVALALLGGLVLGRALPGGYDKVDHPVDLGFARDMSVHHAQAVRMSEILHRRSPDKDLNYLAFDIMTTQQGQIGQMSGWLTLWDQTQSGRGVAMAWMGEPHEGPMPGMASLEEIEQLETLPVEQMHERYLRLMIQHHSGALGMAEYAAKNATSTDLAGLAQTMLDGQANEIDYMQGVLAKRNLPAEVVDATSGEHGGHGG